MPYVPQAIKGHNVEEMIREWHAELERQTAAFVKHAAALSEWDAHILSSRTALLGVGEELQRAMLSQQALERQIGVVEVHQKEIHEALRSVEDEAERLYATERPSQDVDTAERDAMYARAEQVSASLAALGGDLAAAVVDVNSAAAAAAGDATSPLAAAVKILNNQLTALSQVEARVAELQAELDRLDNGPTIVQRIRA